VKHLDEWVESKRRRRPQQSFVGEFRRKEPKMIAQV
jgi:hypothetical protein